jgi:hypothetical protein
MSCAHALEQLLLLRRAVSSMSSRTRSAPALPSAIISCACCRAFASSCALLLEQPLRLLALLRALVQRILDALLARRRVAEDRRERELRQQTISRMKMMNVQKDTPRLRLKTPARAPLLRACMPDRSDSFTSRRAGRRRPAAAAGRARARPPVSVRPGSGTR